MAKRRHSNGYYEGCYRDIDEKWWSCGETMTLKEALDLWWNSVRIEVPVNDGKEKKIYVCYKCAYTDKDGPYELDGLPKSFLKEEIYLSQEYDEDADGYPYVTAVFVDIDPVLKLQPKKEVVKKVYVIVGSFSGEDYETDEPSVFGVYAKKIDARKAFNRVIRDYKPGKGEEADIWEDDDRWECTNLDADEHIVLKIIEQEVK